MDQALLRSYYATLYELPTPGGIVRVSLDGETVRDGEALPELLRTSFALLTAYNPRSMLLPRRVNEGRHLVMRDMLILGCYRVEPAVGYEAEAKDSVWREPAWLTHGMDRDEAIAFGRVFRQNVVIVARDGRPEIIVTDPTADELGKTFEANWRVRT
ncbi:MAG: DUF3293 domain-containing protein [Deltaproteobacteria bacterium]|nr:DUF3293 domain-containing protein [Deltaproteobacteria bacterium]